MWIVIEKYVKCLDLGWCCYSYFGAWLESNQKKRIVNWSQVFEDKIKEPSNFNSFSNWHQQQPLQGGRKLIIFIFYWKKKKHIETNVHVTASVKTID